MKASRRTLLNAGLGVVILGALVGGFLVLNPFGGSATTGATRLTSTVQQGTVSSTITATGVVQPVREVTASFSTSGTIAEVDVAVGETVTAGQKLGALSMSTLEAQLSAAYSSLSTAKSNLALAEAGLSEAQAAAQNPAPGGTAVASVTSSQQQVNSAKNSVTSATASVTQAQAQLAAATLTAPIAGLVIAVDGTVGAAAGGNASGSSGGFATIADVSKLTITANIAEADIASVTVGQVAEVAFPALPDAAATAIVTAIAPTATSSNSIVTYATTITLDTVPTSLRLGETATVTITTATSGANALYIPSAAITTANGSSTVKVVAADGTTKTVTVELGIVGDAGTEITSGLTAGETVVLGTVSPSITSTTNTGGFGGFGGGTQGGGFQGGGFQGRFTGGTGNQNNTQTGGNR